MALALIPVLEFEPALYVHPMRPSPHELADTTPQTWTTYWRTALNDAGIDELTPLRPDGWQVPITQLTRPSTLLTLITRTLNRYAPTCEEEIRRLPGGYVLVCGDAVLEPGCCSDFSTLHNWRDAAGQHSPLWTMVWIGHPWTHIAAEGQILHILPPSEGESPTTLQPMLSVAREELLAAIEQAAQEVALFTERLCTILPEPTLPITKEKLVQILTWGPTAEPLP